jgi:hypothetical protein
MQGAVLFGLRDLCFVERDEPKITKPTMPSSRLSATCLCGSDLWPYRGIQPLAKMEIKRVGSQPSAKGPSDWFTGPTRPHAALSATNRNDVRRTRIISLGAA